jgi:hypothetical protein
MGFLAATLGKYRLLTGDVSFDPLLRRDANGYTLFRLDGRRDRLVRDLERQADAYRVNREAYCEEVRWTDRLVAFHRYANDYLEEPIPTVSPTFVYGTLTGDLGGALYFPMNAVRWKTRPDDMAALVTDSGSDRFGAELFHFGRGSRDMGAELLLLSEGEYEWTLANEDGEVLAGSSIEVSGRRTVIRFQLPSRHLCRLTVEPKRQRRPGARRGSRALQAPGTSNTTVSPDGSA